MLRHFLIADKENVTMKTCGFTVCCSNVNISQYKAQLAITTTSVSIVSIDWDGIKKINDTTHICNTGTLTTKPTHEMSLKAKATEWRHDRDIIVPTQRARPAAVIALTRK